MKNKLAKLMGVVLTAMTVVSLFAFAVPASAATITPQTWTKQSLPGATGYVMPNDMLETGPIVQAADGTLYVYEKDSLPTTAFNILKSTNGGRSWAVTGTAGQPTETVTALVAYGTNLYYTTSTKLFRSTDGGVTFINIANVIGGGTFTAMDVAAYAGRNIIILGTTNDVYFVDESDPFFNLNTVGTPDFASSVGGIVRAVKAAPSFGTDRGVAAISSNGSISFDVMGGAWGGIIGTATVAGTLSAASIRFTSDWNSTTNPNFYFGVTSSTASASGVYAFRGGINVTSTIVQIYASSSSSTASVSSLAVSGTYAAATIYAGIVNAAGVPTQLAWTTNSGVSWSTPTKLQSLTVGKNVYVLLDNNFAAATTGTVTLTTGTVALTSGSPTVTGTGTTFTAAMAPGTITIAGVAYSVTAFVDATHLTLSANAAVSVSGVSFVLSSGSTVYASSPTVYVLVGGTGLVPNDNTGFYYSVDKGVSFNQISLINDSISTVNDLAASSGTTYISTSFNGGGNPTSAIPAGTIVFTAGSYVDIVPAVAASFITVTSGSAGTVIFGMNSGTPPVIAATAPATWIPATNVINFTAAGQTATITATTGPAVFVLTGTIAGVIASITPSGASAVINGSDPNWGISLLQGNVAATVTASLFDNLSIQLAPVPAVGTVSVVFNPVAGGVYNAVTGVLTFASIGQTATITNTSTPPAVVTFTDATATYHANGTFSTVFPTYKITPPGGTAIAFGASPDDTDPFTLIAPVAATTGGNTDSIWRWDGTNFERVFVGFKTLLPTSGTNGSWPANTVVGTATMVRVSSKFATDKTVFYAAIGGIFLSYSTDAGQTWKTQSTAIGAGVASPGSLTADQIDSLLVVDGNTQFIGSHTTSTGSESTLIIKSTTNGVWNILSPAWSEVILKTLLNNTLTGAVAEISVASNGDLVAVVTDPTGTFVFKSTDNGATWKSLASPTDATGATDATLAVSIDPGYLSTGGAFVDPAADYATTGNIFVTLYIGGVYRYSSTAAAVTGSTHNDSIAAVLGWQRVDGASYDTNGAVLIGTGEVVAAGGPGSVAEGSGMVYATDSTVGQGVSRIRGLSTQAEALLSPSGITFTGLWASSILAGNVQLWTVDNTSAVKALYTYVDTLNVAGGTVVVSNVLSNDVTSSATITWPALPNATGYMVFVNTVKQNVLYSATSSTYVSGSSTFPVVTYVSGALTATVSNLLANTTYYVSVWATSPVSSFIYGGASAPVAFTTPLNTPIHGRDLTPALGATNVPVQPNFAWMTVVGATSYTLQITAASDVAFASPVFNSATIPVVTGPDATFNYLGTLSNNTSYIWRVKANGTTGSDWVYGNFTTIPAVTPPVVVTQVPAQPAPTIVITQQPAVTITIPAAQPAPVITLTQPSYTLVTPTAETPTYIWIIVGVGALLTLAVIILIIRTRRVV